MSIINDALDKNTTLNQNLSASKSDRLTEIDNTQYKYESPIISLRKVSPNELHYNLWKLN